LKSFNVFDKITKIMTPKQIQRLITLTRAACYNDEYKQEYRRLGRKFLKEVAKMLNLAQTDYDIRWNAGGIACSGDHILHHEKFYLHFSDNIGSGWFYFRKCAGRKDYRGGMNQIVGLEDLKEKGISHFIPRIANLIQGA
jgi:hypothetical protein